MARLSSSSSAIRIYTSLPSSSFDPTSVTGLKWWLKADAGVYNDAGSTLATNSQTVQQWNDQSGQGNNVTQATSGKRPQYNTGIKNGLPGILFASASSQYLAIASSVVGTAVSYSVFLALRIPAAVGEAVILQVGSGNGYAIELSSANVRQTRHRGINTLADATATATNDEVWSFRRTSTGPDCKLSVNAASQTLTNTTTGLNTPTTASSIGGLDNGTSAFWNSYLFEALVYDNDVGATNQASIETYLNGRWAIY